MLAKLKGPEGWHVNFLPGPIMDNMDVSLEISIFKILPRNFGCPFLLFLDHQ
jgi:hypothetical protein